MSHASVSPELLQRIAEAIASLQYGTVHVTVHDAHVVQIEKIEKVRIAPADRTPGGVRPTHGR